MSLSLQQLFKRPTQRAFEPLTLQPNPFRMGRSLTQLRYLCHETWLGLQRGGWMNWAAVSTVTVLLFLFGTGLQLSLQVDRVLNQVGNQMEISVYLRPGIAATTIQSQVAQLPQVEQVTVISKDQAWQDLLKELGASDLQGASQGLESNPLVDELQVRARNSDDVPALARQIAQIQGVETTNYLDEALRSLTLLQQSLGNIGLALVLLLIVTAVAVISTTIRLIVLSRSQEIEIMQLVGATNSWIYGPFIFQGVGFGIVGALVAWGSLLGSQQVLTQILGQQPDMLKLLGTGGALQASPLQVLLLPLFLLSLGSIIGLAGSFLAVRKLAWR
jgi:cell division transport system permease protein